MKKILFSLLVLAITLPSCAQPIAERLGTLIDAYVHASGFSGTVLVANKGAVILEKGYGNRDKATHAANDSNTIFQIGSITKQFTSAIILQLAEQKKLSLSDSLTKYIPDYPRGNEITIEELLTHESGVYNYTNDPRLAQGGSARPIPRDSMIARFKYKPLDFTPGQKFGYSNSGYFLLGYIIEKVTRQSYFEVARERIFEPLHMDHSGFDFTHLQSPEKAVGYTSPESADPAPIVDSTIAFSAGSIYTTVGDLYRWDCGLRAGKIISLESQQQAYTPHLAKYGYGWMISDVDGKKVVEHGGAITGFISHIRRVPEDGICIVVLKNQERGGDPAKMSRDINSELDGKIVKLPVAKVAIAVDTTVFRQYVGQYQLAPNFILTISVQDGSLYAQATGQGRIKLYAEKQDLFFPKEVDADIEFVRGANGDVEKLILHQNGRDAPAKRL